MPGCSLSSHPTISPHHKPHLLSRLVAIVDSYDALTTDRPYRRASSFREAVEHIKAGRGTHFDPGVVDAFVAIPFQAWTEAARRNGVALRET